MTSRAFAHSLAALFAALAPLAIHAQVQPATNSFPTATPPADAIPAPRDVPYPGTIALDIDATDLATGAFRVAETIPVADGVTRLALLLPEWIPGHHGHYGLPAELDAVHFFAGPRELTWHRDPVDTYAYVVDIPAGTKEIVARMIHTSPFQGNHNDRVTVTREIVNLQWDRMTLYPAGHYVRQIRVKPTVTFPDGFSVFTALDGRSNAGNRFTWGETDYETLVDSPIFAGKYARRLPIGDNVFVDAVADREDQLAISPEHLDAYRAMVKESDALFGARHYDHYDFLLALTDRLTGIGLEHHRSNEETYDGKTWTDWPSGDSDRNVTPHEFVHSWDGKFRRPEGLWTPDYRQPMIDDLLWVYEGQTQFWGLVLGARSGLQTKATVLGEFASIAGGFTLERGRDWRSVADTTYDPIFAARRTKPFPSLSRGEEYYTEGALVWLEADQIIRDGTHQAKGLDDFARAFYGIRPGDWGVVTYTRADVIAALNAVYAYDWAAFFAARIDRAGQPVPLGGIERGGYRLVWKDTPNPYDSAAMNSGKYLSLTGSIGLTIDRDGKVMNTTWGGPAFAAGIAPGSQIVAVNGEAYDAEVIRAAITAAKGTDKPINLLIKRDNRYDTVPVIWHQGLRWPWLEPAGDAKSTAGLDRLLAPRSHAEKGKS